MSTEYKVVDEFKVKDTKILVLDKKRSFEDFMSNHFKSNGEEYACALTHNELWISTAANESFIGKKIMFS